MKGTDKFLAAIVLGVLLLVIVSVVLVITRPPPSYKEENSAENVAYNYLLALQEHNYVRAYGYLSPSLSGYPPSVERFISNLRNAPFPADEGFPPEDGAVSLEIASSRAGSSVIASSTAGPRANLTASLGRKPGREISFFFQFRPRLHRARIATSHPRRAY